jgi:hypothetical protein
MTSDPKLEPDKSPFVDFPEMAKKLITTAGGKTFLTNITRANFGFRANIIGKR